MQVFSKIVFFIGDKIGILANIALVANMGIIVYNVLGRVVFNKPLGGLVDMVSVIFALTVALSISYTEKENGHIKMDLLIQKLPRMGKIVLHTVTGVFAMAVLALLTYMMYYYAGKTLAAHNITMTVGIPIFPFVAVIAVSMTFYFVAMVHNFIKAYGEWRVN